MALSDQSRYIESEFHWVSTQSRGSRYTSYLNPVTYLTVPYSVHLVVEGETMPFLAARYYQDSTRWWVIADANPQAFYPSDLIPGQQLRIPQ